MALALSDFSALCGFLPAFQISEYLCAVPEFASLIPTDVVQHFQSVARSSDESKPKAALKQLFSSYARVDNDKASEQLKRLVERYRAGKETDDERIVKGLVLRLYEMYPDDSGVFCAFILNYFELKSGHAFCVAPGEPHAYISGGEKPLESQSPPSNVLTDIIECMATSDNTIPIAFTPPEDRDTSTFLASVQYNPTPGKTLIQPTMFTRGSTHTTGSLLYNPSIDELAVMQVIVAKGETESHRKLKGPSIIVVVEGEGMVVWAEGAKRLGVRKGQVVFVATGVELKFSAFESGFKFYRAFVEVV